MEAAGQGQLRPEGPRDLHWRTHPRARSSPLAACPPAPHGHLWWPQPSCPCSVPAAPALEQGASSGCLMGGSSGP